MALAWQQGEEVTVQTFEVWLEGAWVPVQRNCGRYKDGELVGQPIPCFGSCEGAKLLGHFEAPSFVDACLWAAPGHEQVKVKTDGVVTIRGRRAFDNETAARRYFG